MSSLGPTSPALQARRAWRWAAIIDGVMVRYSLHVTVRLRLSCPAESKVNPLPAEPEMRLILERHDAMITQPVLRTPNRDITVIERIFDRFIRAFMAAEQKNRRHTQGNRNNRRGIVAFVFVLMQGQPGPWLIAVDQTGIRPEAGKTGRLGSILSELCKQGRHGRPGAPGVRIIAGITIAAPVRGPAQCAAIG